MEWFLSMQNLHVMFADKGMKPLIHIEDTLMIAIDGVAQR